MQINYDNRHFDSRYEIDRENYATRQEARLIFKPFHTKNKSFLGRYKEEELKQDLQELNKLQEHDFYFS
jgi:hypothetical protein